MTSRTRAPYRFNTFSTREQSDSYRCLHWKMYYFTKISPQCLQVRRDAPLLGGADLLVEIENYLEHRREDKEGREDEAWLEVFSVLSFYLFEDICSTKICCETAFSHHWNHSPRHLKNEVKTQRNFHNWPGRTETKNPKIREKIYYRPCLNLLIWTGYHDVFRKQGHHSLQRGRHKTAPNDDSVLLRSHKSGGKCSTDLSFNVLVLPKIKHEGYLKKGWEICHGNPKD